MINWAFGIASFIYTVIGVTGYLMFGDSVSDEVRTNVAMFSEPLNSQSYSSAKTSCVFLDTIHY